MLKSNITWFGWRSRKCPFESNESLIIMFYVYRETGLVLCTSNSTKESATSCNFKLSYNYPGFDHPQVVCIISISRHGPMKTGGRKLYCPAKLGRVGRTGAKPDALLDHESKLQSLLTPPHTQLQPSGVSRGQLEASLHCIHSWWGFGDKSRCSAR